MAVTTLVVLACALVSWPAAAATINWGTPTTIAGDTDVINSGAARYAYTGGTAATVNGVSFSAGTGYAAWGSVSFTSGFTASTTNAYAGATGLSLSYSNLLVGGAYGGAAAGTVTLNNLTPNEAYAVQVWVNDPRSAGVGRYETVSNTVAGTSTALLIYNAASTLGSPGQYVIGTFLANGTSQAFALVPSAGGSVQLNAISVRDLGGPNKIWLGSSDSSWGTGANWSPGGAPLAGQSVVFNNLSTANLATEPDQSYTLGTLALSNAPAPVTIGPSGFTLNVNGGINLFGSAQSLTINDPVELGNFQTWTNDGNLTINAGVSGSAALTIAGSGVVTFTQPATYLNNTTISGGTLALSGSGALTSANIAVAGGATLDVSAEPSIFTLGGGTLGNSSSGAVINGANDCSFGTLNLAFDGTNPCFIQTNGSMTISSSTVITVNCSGGVLPAGTYTLIAAATTGNNGQVSGTVPNPTLVGNGAVGAASLVIDGTGNLNLVIATPDVWTGAVSGSWSNGGNWNPANEPNLGDSILFNNLSAAHLNVSQDDTVAGGAIYGLTVLNPIGPVTISGPGNLSVYDGGLNLAAASQNLTIAAPLVINANQTWLTTNSRNLTVSGPVSSISGGNVTVSGGGTVQMGAAHVLDGLTNNAGTSDFTVNGGKLDLNGYSQVMNGLNSGTNAVVDNTTASPVTLTIGGNGDGSINGGVIQNSGGGALQLQVAGGDVQLLSTNTYSGGTIFNGGRLYFPNSSVLGTGPVTFNPGSGAYTYGVTFTNALTLNGAYLHLGGGGYPNLVNQTWSGPVTVANGFSMSGDNQGCTLTLSGPMNIGTGGISVTNFGNNGPQEGYQVSLTGDLLSGPISGSGGITYNLSGGNSRLTVQGANTYTGGTTVNGDPASPGGKLNVGGGVNPFGSGAVTLNANAIIEAAPGSGTVTNALFLNGGTLQSEPQYNNYNQLFWTGPITLTADSTLVQNATGALNSNQSSGVNVSGSLNINGFTLTCSSPVSCYGGNTISGSISGSGNILENGVGIQSLSIQGSNTFSGTFRAVNGTLSVQNAYALQNATLDMNAADAGSVALNNYGVVIGALTGSRNLTLGSATVSIGNNNASSQYDGVLSGGANLVKVGSGTLTLTGLNTYSGNTTVSAGTLSLSQPNFSFGSKVTVAGGAVLDLNAATTNTVTALVLAGVNEPYGLYNAGNSGGLITGSGAIQVGVIPNVWTGDASTDWSINDDGAPYNWKYNGVGANYADGSAVQFDDSAPAANTNVSISAGNVMPIGVIFNNTTNNYTVSGGSGIAGTASLSKSGTGSVTLLTPNTFTGGIAINAGKLTIGAGGSLGATYGGGISIATNSTFEYSSGSATLSGAITGPGGLLFDSASAGTLTLSGGNSYSGPTIITNSVNAGIKLSAGGVSLPAATTFTILGNATSGGQLYINAAGVYPNNFNISGFGYHDYNYYGAIKLAASGVTLTGTINLVGNAEIGSETSSSGSATISGQITGGGGLTFLGGFDSTSTVGTYTYLLANTGTPNNYTGNTAINNYYGTGGSSTTTTTILELGADNQIPSGPGAGLLTFNNGNNGNRGVAFELNGHNQTINGTTVANAGVYTVIRNTTAGASTLAIGAGNTNSTFSGTISDGGVGKTLAINKIGTGTLTVSGANTYIGGTTINGGSLLVNNSSGSGTGTGAVNINNGGALGGTGTITGLVSNQAGGILYPGSGGGIGKLTLSGGLTLQANSTNKFVVNGSTVVASNSIAVGTSVVTYGGVLNIVTNGTFTLGQSFQLFSGAGATNASTFASIAGSPGPGLAFSFANGWLTVITAPTGPTLASVSSVTGSSFPVSLSLNGSGFVSGCMVNLTNATASTSINGITPTFNSSSSLTASAVVGTAASTWNATVINPGPAASDQAAFTVYAPAKVSIVAGSLGSAGAGKLVLSGSGGVAGNDYAVLNATNLNPPVVWNPVVTNKFDGSGSFSYTNTVNAGTPQLFLRIQQ